MAKRFPTSCSMAVVLFLVASLPSISSVESKELPCPPAPGLSPKFATNPAAIELASTDYGNIVHDKPVALFNPSSVDDIVSLVRASYNCPSPFGISVRGNGHSSRGQDMALDGVVVNMAYLRASRNGTGISISSSTDPLFADVGGEQLWIDILNATTEQGLAPVSWTDYLELSVGGTLSYAGISGQTSQFGPQISNVYELDVVTGKGELMTCSADNNSELFYGVLGGLGQFGIITRARIALAPAPKRVKWFRALYSNFSAFSADQEILISDKFERKGPFYDYVEGQILLDNGTPNTWETSFFPSVLLPNISSLVKEFGIIYCLEVTKSYDFDDDATTSLSKNIDKELQKFNRRLSYIPGFLYEVDVTHQEFLTRVPTDDQRNVSHPWLNLFIPKSRIQDFNSGVIRDIVLARNISTGPFLLYPMNRNKWNGNMSAVIPDEEVFYTAALLHTSGVDNWQVYEDQNKAIIQYCDNAGIKVKQYLPNYTTKQEWINHFGSRWSTFQGRKAQFDPKMILSPGQRIFNNN